MRRLRKAHEGGECVRLRSDSTGILACISFLLCAPAFAAITGDVRNQTTADWSEDHVFRCLAWLYDGAPLPTEPPAR